ncbi:MAG: hypothetical protein ACLRU1_03630 [Veillonella parvula]
MLLCSSPSFASGTSSTSQTEATITIPLTQWNELKSNNEKALSLIETSSMPLTEAQTLVMKQKNELTRSTQYNIDIGNRIDESKNAIHEARDYLKRNVELIDRIEGANRERQTNNQTLTDATQPISDGGSGSSNRSSDSSVKR